MRDAGDRTRRRRVAVVVAGSVVIGVVGALLVGRIGRDRTAPEPLRTPATADAALPRSPAETPSLTLPAAGDLGRWLVGSELAFGSPPAERAALADVYEAQVEVADALHRTAYDRGSGQPAADVVVLALDGSSFTRDEQVDAYVRSVVVALGEPGAADGAAALEEGEFSGYRAWALGSAAALRDGGLAVVVTGPAARGVIGTMAAAVAAGEVGSSVPFTPLLPADPATVFVELAGSVFAPLPADAAAPGDGSLLAPPTDVDEPLDRAGAATELPSVPAVEGVTGFPAVRVVGIGGEWRGVVHAFGVDVATVPSAEAADAAIARSFPAASASVVAGHPVWAEAIDEGRWTARRVVRIGAVVAVIAGDDATTIDAVVAEWLTALAGR